MRFDDLLFLLKESNSSTALISIDIQPEYIKSNSKLLRNYIDFLNSYKGQIFIFWNGEELGMSSKNDLIYFLIENGLDESKVDEIQWREKTYAFFRDWMDEGISRNLIIKAIRFMVMNKIYDSRDVSEDQWRTLFGSDYEYVEFILTDSYILSIPDISISELKSVSGFYLCGGGKDECLSEFRLLLEAFNIKYKIIDKLTY